MSKVAVVHIITKLELGGAQEITLYTVRNLTRGSYDAALITGWGGILSPEARTIQDMEFHEVPELVREVSPFRDLKALLRIRGILRVYVRRYGKNNVIVHTHSSKAGIVGRWAAWLAGARLIVHSIHGFGFNDFQRPAKRAFFVALERATAAISRAFTADSQANIDKGESLSLFNGKPAIVARCAIPVPFFAQDPGGLRKDDIGVPTDAPVVAMISCLKPQKAPVDFVRVAARVLESVPDAHFIQAGDGELRGEVLAEADRLGISGRFHLLGWRRDVREIIHLSDVIVLTSLWEGLPRVIPQAMAAGKPVVATAVDGTPEAVRDGVNGFLARPHDVDLMAEKVALLLKDEGLRKEMGENGRELVSEFDEVGMLNGLCALYERLLEEAV
jgi:glycosyltransferase involved in cell wall biosynthesis